MAGTPHRATDPQLPRSAPSKFVLAVARVSADLRRRAASGVVQARARAATLTQGNLTLTR
jgi:hypothetical protein